MRGPFPSGGSAPCPCPWCVIECCGFVSQAMPCLRFDSNLHSGFHFTAVGDTRQVDCKESLGSCPRLEESGSGEETQNPEFSGCHSSADVVFLSKTLVRAREKVSVQCLWCCSGPWSCCKIFLASRILRALAKRGFCPSVLPR